MPSTNIGFLVLKMIIFSLNVLNKCKHPTDVHNI